MLDEVVDSLNELLPSDKEIITEEFVKEVANRSKEALKLRVETIPPVADSLTNIVKSGLNVIHPPLDCALPSFTNRLSEIKTVSDLLKVLHRLLDIVSSPLLHSRNANRLLTRLSSATGVSSSAYAAEPTLAELLIGRTGSVAHFIKSILQGVDGVLYGIILCLDGLKLRIFGIILPLNLVASLLQRVDNSFLFLHCLRGVFKFRSVISNSLLSVLDALYNVFVRHFVLSVSQLVNLVRQGIEINSLLQIENISLLLKIGELLTHLRVRVSRILNGVLLRLDSRNLLIVILKNITASSSLDKLITLSSKSLKLAIKRSHPVCERIESRSSLSFHLSHCKLQLVLSFSISLNLIFKSLHSDERSVRILVDITLRRVNKALIVIDSISQRI